MDKDQNINLEELSKNLNQKEKELYLLRRMNEVLKRSDSNIENILNNLIETLPDDWDYDNINIFLKKLKQTVIDWKNNQDTPEANRKKEWKILIDLLKRIDMNLFLRISRKMMNYLCRIGIKEAINLIQSYNIEKTTEDYRSLLETNKPSDKKDLNTLINLSDVTFLIASHYISDEEIISNIQRWIKEDKLSVLLQTIEKLDSSLTDIFDAITRYHIHAPEKIEFSPYLKKNVSALLINRFFTDQLDFINIAKNYVDMDDFYNILQHTIAPNNSHGKLGGKSAGLYLANKIVKTSNELNGIKDFIRIPKTWYISSDTFQYFLYYNNLEEYVEHKYKDIEDIRQEYPNIIQIFKNSYFPPEIIKGLYLALEDFGENPIIVRSSSLLEDRLGSAFSGKYKSLFLGNQGTKEERLVAVLDAIAEVYSSIYGPDPMQYRVERGLLDFDEEMAVMIQEVVGTKVGKYFCPTFAGVAFSNNEFRWSPRIKREDGLLRIVLGLGTRAVDRLGDDYPILVAPGNPNIRVNVSPEEMYRYSPRKIDLINLEKNCFETITIGKLFKECGKDFPNIENIVSVWEDNNIRSKPFFSIDFENDDLVVTMNGVISGSPMVKEMKMMVDVIRDKMFSPVDLEFASVGDYVYILQCRSQSYSTENLPSPIPRDIEDRKIIFTAKKFVSNGKIRDISHIVYVDPEKYSAISSLNIFKDVGRAINKINAMLPKKKFILIGPGRWGSRGDIKLGVDVTYSDINNTAMLIEVAKKKGNYLPDLSFGTHFFQDLVEANIRYLPLYPDDEDVKFNYDFFRNSKNIFSELLPDYSYLESVIHVIDIPTYNDGMILRVLANAEIDQAIAYLDKKSEFVYQDSKFEKVPDLHVEDYSRWRLRMIEIVASKLDMEKYGVKGLYIIGSAKNITADPKSDIDLIVHFEGTDLQKGEMYAWFEGWSMSLSEQNYAKTGFRVDKILDIHIVTDSEIKEKTGFGVKINAVTDPARPLRLKS